MTFAELVQAIKTQHNLTLSAFAEGINACLHPSEAYDRMTIHNWSRGVYSPRYSTLDYIQRHAVPGSWQDVLASGGMAIIDAQNQPAIA